MLSGTEYQGIGIGRACRVGKIVLLSDSFHVPEDQKFSGDITAEQTRLSAGYQAVVADLQAAALQATGAAQEILLTTAEIAADPEVLAKAAKLVANGKTAERAVHEAFGSYIEQLSQLGGYLAERSSDLKDVAKRIVHKLQGKTGSELPYPKSAQELPLIVVAEDLAPADTAQFEVAKIAGMVTVAGSATSHTAILAKSKGLPALLGVQQAMQLPDGAVAIIDAASGILTLNPSAEQQAAVIAREQKRLQAQRDCLAAGQTRDGHPIQILANIGGPADSRQALELGAEGVGLFRTEFLFLDSQTAPTIAEQELAYRKVLEDFTGKKVVVRLLDAGADKPLKFLPKLDEQNPALGLRGYRLQREYQSVLADQLASLANARADTGTELWVMAPMIADAAEAKEFYQQAKKYDLPVVGVMAEVPAIAVMALEVFEAVDFISIGTNDLAQYTFAADRMLSGLSRYQNPKHPALLRLIKQICDAGLKHGKPVSVCGEAASDPEIAVILVGLGVSSLSMSAFAMSDVRAELAKYTLAEAQALAAAALK